MFIINDIVIKTSLILIRVLCHPRLLDTLLIIWVCRIVTPNDRKMNWRAKYVVRDLQAKQKVESGFTPNLWRATEKIKRTLFN